MKTSSAPRDQRALVAVDLGAESCRVSLLRWKQNKPITQLVHRFPNAPRQREGGLRWDLEKITLGLEDGLRLAATLAPEGIRASAVDGWAVDYVRMDETGNPLADPYCYRDERNTNALDEAHTKISIDRMRQITGLQIMPLNTIYQLYADQLANNQAPALWLNLPEYFLHRWGGAPVAELTNATHTQLIEIERQQWSSEIFSALGLDAAAAPNIVMPGTIVGQLTGALATLPAFSNTQLIAPACHDTASAIAGIPAHGDDWAYISSGTWSLVGTLLDRPQNTTATAQENFTNLGAVGGKICFHKNVNGMWLLKQCMEEWAAAGHVWEIEGLIQRASKTACPVGLLVVDEPQLLLPGQMPERINQQRILKGFKPLDDSAANAPEFASLIFHSLANRYAEVLKKIEVLSGKRLKHLFIVGGGSQNLFLNQLTEASTGLTVHRGAVESATIGNFAIQLATLEDGSTSADAASVARWAGILQTD